MVFAGFIVFVIVIVPLLLLAGINPLSLADIPSLGLVAGLPLAIIVVNYGFKTVLSLAIFFFSGALDKDQLIPSLHALKYVSVSIIPFGLLGALLGGVLYLQNSADDPSLTGRAFAMAILCPVYAIIIRYVLVIPTLMKLKAYAREAN